MPNIKPSTLLLGVLLIIGFLELPAQNPSPNYNLDFELVDENEGLAQGFITWGDFPVSIVEGELEGSSKALLIESASVNREYGAMIRQIPGGFKGNLITLKGSVKTENIRDGYAGLVIRLNGRSGLIKYDDQGRRGLKGTNDWTEVKVNLKYPDKEVRDIYVGGILKGDGKAWFDNLSLEINGKPIEGLERFELAKYPAETDHEFDAGSGINWQETGPELETSLFKMAKIWGFLKYHHPSIAKGNVNWDFELFRWFHQIQDTPLHQIIEQSLVKLGPPNKKQKRDVPRHEMKLKPENDWLRDPKVLSERLTAQFLAIENGQKEKSHFYLAITFGARNPIFKNEVPYSKMKWDDSGLKLLALFRFWNMTQYFFPNRHLMDENWDDVLKEFIPKMIKSKGELEYKLLLVKLIGKLQDTHARVVGNDDALNGYFGFKAVPVQLRFIEEKPTVVAVSPLLGDNSPLKVGDVILQIEGKDVSEKIQELWPYSSSSNLSTRFRIVSSLLLRTNEAELHLRVADASGEREVIAPTESYGKIRPSYPIEGSHKLIQDDIGYLYPGSLGRGEIHEIMPKFMDKKGLIIDFRCYPSDFIVFSLTREYLMHKRSDFVQFTRGSLSHPGAITFERTLKVGKKSKKAFQGKVVILVDERTQSSAEYHVMAFQQISNSTVVGSQTAGADGNVSRISLPGDVNTRFSGIGILYPDGRESQRIGIVPDVKVRPTVEGIRAGRDELLEKAVELIRSGSKED